MGIHSQFFETSVRIKTECTRALYFVFIRPEKSKYWVEWYERCDVESCGGMGLGGKEVMADLN